MIETSSESDVMAAAIPNPVSRISPQQGLLVAFTSAAQTFGNHLWPAMTLGMVGTILLLIGLTSRDGEADRPVDGYEPSPGNWWFSG